jgi:hypothetical protein
MQTIVLHQCALYLATEYLTPIIIIKNNMEKKFLIWACNLKIIWNLIYAKCSILRSCSREFHMISYRSAFYARTK